jgi:hypothetical protein
MTEDAEKITAFHQALGRFITRFSEIEALLLRTLWACAGIGAPKAQAVLSGVKVEGAMGYINRIAAAEQWHRHRRALIQRAFSQLGLINKLRNGILHYGTEPDGPDTWIVTNKHFVHIPENISQMVISVTTLDHARYDLDKIECQLLLLISDPNRMRGPERKIFMRF